VRVGIAHHLGWAVVVTASGEHGVVDRRRVELIEPGLSAAPIHHEGGRHPMHRSNAPLDDEALAALVAAVRASAVRTTSLALDELAAALGAPITSVSVRGWAPAFPTAIATCRRAPFESRADSVMYCQVVADVAAGRGWRVHQFDAATVEARAGGILGARAHEVLHGPRAVLGPPWSKDHRIALAATVVAAAEGQDAPPAGRPGDR
jgi:hypothetical protein